ncbi:cytochrome c oxidase subunit II [Marinicrinis lubricantis]|uniref:Cytochrome c oxidase subunit 2 n=1 Tax=Marinicrinis lubricantis TaxID=2086470 RepID=A0ABW1IU42_9BACL
MRPWKLAKRLVPLFLLFTLVLSGCSSILGDDPSPLNPKGSVGEDQLFLIKLSLFVMTGVLVIVFVLFGYVVIRFRKRKNQTGVPKQTEGSHVLEIVWTVIPLVLLLILAVPMVTQTFALAKDYSESEEAEQVKVIGHQFWWEFQYPEHGIYTAQDLVIPVNTKIAFELTSADVIHSFWIPGLGGKMDTNPGMTNKFYLDAEEVGTYKGKCAELCGASHALMDFKVQVVTQEEYEAWVASMKEPSQAVNEQDALAQGQEIFKAKCMSCHAIDGTQPGVYPNLKGFADRELVAGIKENNAEWIRKWIDDPQSIKPGTLMPNVDLTDDELDALTEYLQSLKLE